MTEPRLNDLDEPYRSRAIPPGSLRHVSWLFAARGSRAPLLGAYALAAEWQALTDAGIEIAAAQLKIAWWRDELERWASGSPLHPITRWLSGIPGVQGADIAPLRQCIDAVAAQAAGTPLQHADELQAHAAALLGAPLVMAARIAGRFSGSVLACTNALAVGRYLASAMARYPADARAGRTPFPVDELLAAGIDDGALRSPVPPPALQQYLARLRRRAGACFAAAAAALDPEERPALRHLLVLADLGARQLNRAQRTRAEVSLLDLFHAWGAARRANRAPRTDKEP
jgi:phytoene synthase